MRLEVAILAAAEVAPAVVPPPRADGQHRTITVVAADADVRWHVRECLRDRPDVRVLEAASVAVALSLAAQAEPDVLIVDAPQGDVIVALPRARAVVIVDDVPRQPRREGARVRFLARPFTAQQLVAEVDRVRES